MFDIKKRLRFLTVAMTSTCITLTPGNAHRMFERSFDLIYVRRLGFVWCVMFRVGLMRPEPKRCKLYTLKFASIFNESENAFFFCLLIIKVNL